MTTVLLRLNTPNHILRSRCLTRLPLVPRRSCGAAAQYSPVQHRGQKQHHGGTGERAGDASRPERTPLSGCEGREAAAGATSAAGAGSANSRVSARHGVAPGPHDSPFISSDSKQNSSVSCEENQLTPQNGRPADCYSRQGQEGAA